MNERKKGESKNLRGYQIIASFEGDNSYGSSSASTFVTVGPAISAGQEPETEPPTGTPTADAPFPTTEVIIIAAVAIATVIGIGAY